MWDPDAYKIVEGVQRKWGRRLLGHLELRGHERVLDAGCGPGGSSELLLQKLPHGHVVGLDSDPKMLDRCRENYGDDPRLTLVDGDLAQPFPATLSRIADAVFSVAAFHWVTDHAVLWRNVAGVLVPGGRVVAECGGYGNLAQIERALGAPFTGRYFGDVDSTVERLRVAGLVPDDVRLRAAPQDYESRQALVEDVRTLVLHRMALEDVERIVARLPEPVLDWVRLEVVAHRA